MAVKKNPTKGQSPDDLVKRLATLLGSNEEESEEDKQDDLRALQQVTDEQTRQRKEPHYWITIIRLQGDNEDKVFVGAAGVGYHLTKGVRVPVPVSVINALKLAKVAGYIPIIDEATGQKRQAKVSYESYPFQNDGPASLEEVKAWRAEQDRLARHREGLAELPPEEVIGRPVIEYGQPVPIIEG